MHLASTAVSPYLVETVRPVDAEESEHAEVDARTHAGAPLEVEGREIADVGPAVSGLGESDGIDCGGGLQQEGEVELYGEFAIGVSLISAGSELAVLISAHRDCLGSVGVVSGHAVTSEVECLEGGLVVLGPGSEQTEVGTGHQHKCPLAVGVGERSESLALEADLVIVDPSVHLGPRRLARRIVLVVVACQFGESLPVLSAEE